MGLRGTVLGAAPCRRHRRRPEPSPLWITTAVSPKLRAFPTRPRPGLLRSRLRSPICTDASAPAWLAVGASGLEYIAVMLARGFSGRHFFAGQRRRQKHLLVPEGGLTEGFLICSS